MKSYKKKPIKNKAISFRCAKDEIDIINAIVNAGRLNRSYEITKSVHEHFNVLRKQLIARGLLDKTIPELP